MDVEYVKRLIDLGEYVLAKEALDVLDVEHRAALAIESHDNPIGQPAGE